MTMKEHKSELQQKVITLEHALNQARYELSERAVEVINPEDRRHFLQLCYPQVVIASKLFARNEFGIFWLQPKNILSRTQILMYPTLCLMHREEAY